MLVAGSRLLVSTSTEAGGLIAIGQIEALEPTTGAPLARATPWEMSTRLPAPVVDGDCAVSLGRKFDNGNRNPTVSRTWS